MIIHSDNVTVILSIYVIENWKYFSSMWFKGTFTPNMTSIPNMIKKTLSGYLTRDRMESYVILIGMVKDIFLNRFRDAIIDLLSDAIERFHL